MNSKKIKINKNKPTIFFDMDGTLYSFKTGSFGKSPLKKKINENASLFLMSTLKVSNAESKKILKEIEKKYGENTSIGLEESYDIPRDIYFNTVWNIMAKDIIKYDKKIKNLIISLKKKYNLLIVSDSPRVWLINALKEMNIYYELKNTLISGEGKYRKVFNNQFEYIIKTYKLKADNCISIGDQEKTDIIPAKGLGMKTILIGKNKSKYANFTISNIKKITKII